MKKLFILVILLLAAFLLYRFIFKKNKPPREKPVPVAVSKHSDAFNKSIGDVLNNYYAMTDGFVNWDSEVVHKNAVLVQSALNNFKVDELKKDSTIYETVLFPLENAKGAVARILETGDWTDKRHALQDLSDNIRMLLLTVKYDQGIAYWQECPMAFGEGQAGNWLSNKSEVINPYLGEKDPKYGNSMLNCGETKTTINFTNADSTKLH